MSKQSFKQSIWKRNEMERESQFQAPKGDLGNSDIKLA